MTQEPNTKHAAFRVRDIPANTVVHTPTEEEAKELLSILGKVYKISAWDKYNDQLAYRVSETIPTYANVEWYKMQKGSTILTLAEFKERYVLNEDSFAKSEDEKPQPKFKVGDKVKVIEPNCWHSGQIGIVRKSRTSSGQVMVAFSEGGAANFYSEECLEPYAEPKTKPTEDMETKEKEQGEKGNNSENSQLDLCELLKGHEGETFYSPVCGTDIELKTVFKSFLVFYLDKDDDCTIECETRGWQRIGTLDDCGIFKSITYPNSACLIYPSRALYEQSPLDPYTAWMKWRGEQRKYSLTITYQKIIGAVHGCGGKTIDNLTETQCDKCIEVIDAFLKQIQQSKSVASLCEEIKAVIEKYSKK